MVDGVTLSFISTGLSLVQFRELLGNRRINELSLRFRVGSLTFFGGTFSSVPLFLKWNFDRGSFVVVVVFYVPAVL